jgi:2-polyprenyl-3-methyl-5-hydroxy-6-metoxy-1,4-benzoquinol methylase
MLYESINIPLWRNLRNVTGWHILDIGCGTGGIGELLEESGNCVDGITHSEEEAAIASTRSHRVLLMDLNDCSAIKRTIEKNSYDALLLAGVLEHLVDPLATLKGIRTRLDEGEKGLHFVA